MNFGDKSSYQPVYTPWKILDERTHEEYYNQGPYLDQNSNLINFSFDFSPDINEKVIDIHFEDDWSLCRSNPDEYQTRDEELEEELSLLEQELHTVNMEDGSEDRYSSSSTS